MRVVTKQEYETFALLLGEIKKKSKEYEKQANKAFRKLHLMSLIGNSEKAAAEAKTTIESLTNSFEALLMQFEASAITCFGMTRNEHESLAGFVERVSIMPEQELVRTIIQNSLSWEN